MLCLSMPSSSVKFDQKVAIGVTESNLSPPKRPKLSLQTTVCDRPRTFGKSSTTLMLATSTSGETNNSPTINNTYFNAFHAPRQTAATTTNLTFQSPPTTITPSSSSTHHNRTSTLLRPSSSDDAPKLPYTQPLGLRSILRHGPLPRPAPRSASSRHQRPRFPAPKRVLYKTPIQEEIRTSRYTATHFDLVLLEREQKAANGAEDEESVQCPPTAGQESDSDEDAAATARRKDDDGEDVAGTPLSPRKRGKQKREWTWTLAPPLSQQQQQQQGVQDRETRATVEKPHG
ncbi:MAG: hypothetical protein M1816_002336 [Peltula sp. TS41687]|nr:MAG: hypothetical protein M1816_002336 [Peltula sp. TS41687]